MKKFFLLIFSIILNACHQDKNENTNVKEKITQPTFLNHADSAKYVGKQTCMLCHQNIYNTFIQTGMGKSLRYAIKENSSAQFYNAYLYDKFSDFHYHAFLKNDSIYLKEYRLKNKDTIFMMLQKIDYIIGSGHHTNSHLYSINGYLYQAPMTFYTQKKIWDLPPGFENGHNTRFFRKIGVECITCHNAYPQFIEGSENKYAQMPTGIDCERCHGPGSIHVNKIRNGNITDTTRAIDYSIVNPAKLPIDRQFDICMRCHLQGNAVLVNHASFFDFKPGMKLNKFIQVFLPRYSDSKDNFIMASHADRLKQSQCFIQSLKKARKTNTLKPYQQALTCVTCHNPHISVRITKDEKFNAACINCHQPGAISNKQCTSPIYISALKKHDKKNTNCISCHMPISGSKDIPHVSIHDHFIRIPEKKHSVKNKSQTHQFIGLFCINDSFPSKETKALAYIYQYEKFDPFQYYLDSAEKILNITNIKEAQAFLHTFIHLLFLKNEFFKIDALIKKINITSLLNQLKHKSIENTDAWTSYRIGEAEYKIGNLKEAELFYENAVHLAPFILDFRNKLAIAQMQNGKSIQAYQNWLWIIKENPMYVTAYSNLGYFKMQQQQLDSAYYYFHKAENIDPDNEMLLLNKTALYIYTHQFNNAQKNLLHLLNKHPDNIQAKQLLKQIHE